MKFDSVFHNYDVRGKFGSELTVEMANKIAKAFVVYAKPKKVVVGMDNRISSPDVRKAIVEGLLFMGVDVIDVGMVSTDVFYFSTWSKKLDGGIMITASHMPSEFNGLKFLKLNEGGVLAPIGRGIGMEELEEIYNKGEFNQAEKLGNLEEKNVWSDFVNFTLGFVNINNIKKLKVVMDAGNGMAGVVANKVFKDVNLDIERMYFEPDGNYPNHQANPLVEENRIDIMKRVKDIQADLGIAWDADCDRVYFIDENGKFINGDFIVALLAIYFLKKNPDKNGIVYDLRCSWAIKNWVEKLGGQAHLEKVGHTYIKKTMQDTKSIFGGELSGHYYFADNAYMENGFVPALVILELMSTENKKLSELIADLGDYYVSGEINFEVDVVDKVLDKLEKLYSEQGEITKLDGLSFETKDWRFNVRPSANDPVLRLNLEATSEEVMKKKVEEVSNVIVGAN